MTSCIVNPSFEMGDFTGWTVTGMALQNNSIFGIKNGTYFAERWTGRGAAVGNALMTQTVKNLPLGRYRLKAVAQNIQENTPNTAQSGACIFAGSHDQTVTTTQDYTLEFVLVSEQLKLGFKAEEATGNWLAVDHFRLEYISDDFDDVMNEFSQLIARAGELVLLKMNETARQQLQTAIDAASQLLGQTTAEYLNQAGRIYWLRDLKPATVYYMRAYAITKDYGVGYGDAIKVVTLPKGTIGHWYNNGCNGAHEDTHSDNLYCMMGILAQALTETANHQLQWTAMTIEEAQANDAAAWYLTFTPDNQYYQLRNAASGYYMTYSSGFKTTKVSTGSSLPAATNLHLMRGRVDVAGHRGYYIIHPESSANPPTLTANANGKTASNSLSTSPSCSTIPTSIPMLPRDGPRPTALRATKHRQPSSTSAR